MVVFEKCAVSLLEARSLVGACARSGFCSAICSLMMLARSLNGAGGRPGQQRSRLDCSLLLHRRRADGNGWHARARAAFQSIWFGVRTDRALLARAIGRRQWANGRRSPNTGALALANASAAVTHDGHTPPPRSRLHLKARDWRVFSTPTNVGCKRPDWTEGCKSDQLASGGGRRWRASGALPVARVLPLPPIISLTF